MKSNAVPSTADRVWRRQASIIAALIVGLLGLATPLPGLLSSAGASPGIQEQRVFYQKYSATSPTCPVGSSPHSYGCLGASNAFSTSTFYSARSNGTDEQAIPLMCTGATPHWMAPFDGTTKIEVDTAKSKLYWENSGEPGIVRSNFDGTGCELVGNGEYYGYESIAVDDTGDYLYSLRYDRLRRLNIATGVLDYLALTGLSFTPNGSYQDLTVAGNTLYMTLNDVASVGYIVAVTLDTSTTAQAASALVTQAAGMRAISIDSTNGYVYWATGSAVKRAVLSDGTGVQTIKSGSYNYVVAMPTENRLLIGTSGNQVASYTSLTGVGLTSTSIKPNTWPTAGAVDVVPVAQSVTWAPTTAVHISPASPTLATTTGDGAISYAVQSAGSTGCTVNAATAQLTFSADGSCTVRATAAATGYYTTALADVTFTVTMPVAQTVTWTPTTAVHLSPASPAAATTSGDGAITYAVQSAGTTGCTVNPTTGQLTFTSDGSCTVRATAAATVGYTTALNEVTFVVTIPVAQTVTWTPTTAVHISPASPLPATTSGDGAITYAVQSAGTTGCAVNATTGQLTFTANGSCIVRAAAASTVGHTAAFNDVTFVVTIPVAQTVTWTPSVALTASPTTPTTTAATTGDGAITYAVQSAGTTGCTVSATTGQLTFTADGSCTVRATAAATVGYTTAFADVIFTVTIPPAPTTTTTTPTTVPAPTGSIGIKLALAEGQPVADSSVTISGSGLRPFSTATIELHSTPVVLGTAQADASGSFTATVRLPAEIPAGEHHIVVAGISSAGVAVSAQQPLVVDWAGALVSTVGYDGYHSVMPYRMLDTRITTALAAGDTVQLSVGATAGVPADATAVVANFTSTEQNGSGYLTVHPCDSVRPLASTLNFTAGRTAANMAISSLGGDHAMCVYTSAATQLVVDIVGYFGPNGDRFSAQPPTRLLDTRTSSRVAADTTIKLPIGSIDASAAVINIIAVNPLDAGFVTVYPCDTRMPLSSTANFSAGSVVSAQAFAPVVESMICVYSSAETDLVVDVSGLFTPTGTSSFVRMSPGRIIDTRDGGALMPDTEYVVDLAPLPANTAAVALNVTVTDPHGAGYLTLYPCGAKAPATSNVNFIAGATVANHVTASLGIDRTVCIIASQQLDLIVDITGMYTAG